MHLIKTEDIKDCYTTKGDSWNWWCELAAAIFLGPCSLCQVARQVYGYDEHSWLDGDAKWDRPDEWEYAEGKYGELVRRGVGMFLLLHALCVCGVPYILCPTCPVCPISSPHRAIHILTLLLPFWSLWYLTKVHPIPQ
jgi:hypothetical protein